MVSRRLLVDVGCFIFIIQAVVCTIVGVTLVEDYKAMHRTNTKVKRQVDTALSGLSDGEHTLRTRRVFVE